MTTKTPSGLAADGAGSDDETIDDSLDQILLQANERTHESPVRAPVPKLQLPRPGMATLIGVASPSLPLPGAAPPAPIVPPAPVAPAVSAELADEPVSEVTPAVVPRSDDITQIARSSLLDDEPHDESTKVEPVETALRAAASKDEVEVALTEQASVEREKALRKSFPPGPRLSEGAEFEEPRDTGELEVRSADSINDTPASIAVEDDDDESTANGRGPLSGAGGALSPPLSLGSPRLPPPGAPAVSRSEPFSARLPTPGAGFGIPAPTPGTGVPLSTNTLLGVPAHASAYASATPVPGYGPPVGSSAFGGTRASSPAVPIPAPLGAPASVRRSPVFNKVQLPVGGLVAFLIAAFSLGLVVGALRWRGEEPEAPIVVAPPPPAPVVAPVAAPVVQPVVAAPTPAPTQVAPAPSAAEAEPAAVPAAAAPAAIEPTVIPPAPSPPPRPTTVARPARRPPPVASATEDALLGGGPLPAPAPKPSRPKKSGAKAQVDSRGVAKGWVDPFSQ